MHRSRVRPVGARPSFVVAIVFTILASCGGSAAPAAIPGPTVTQPVSVGSGTSGTLGNGAQTTVPSDVMTTDYDALVAEVMAMPTAEQEAYVAQLSSDFELQLAQLSGLEDALGGPEAAAAALVEAWSPIVDQVRAAASGTKPIGFRSGITPGGTPNIGEGLFGAFLTIGLVGSVAVTASNSAKAGDPPQVDAGKELRLSRSVGEVSFDMDVTHTDKVTTKLKVHVKVLPCPDPEGFYAAEASAEMSAETGGVGQTGTIEVHVAGLVDDDAKQVEMYHDYRMQWADFAGGRGMFADISGGTGKDPTLNRSGGAVTSSFAEATWATGQTFGLLIAVMLSYAAENGWTSGRCVQLDAAASPGPTGLEPDSSSTITASPRSKIDGLPTGGNVTAIMGSGGATVEPMSTPMPADAEFTYRAPTEVDQQGTVQLESRSRRGVGKAEITLDTKQTGYTAAYSDGEITISGTIASLAEPFTTTGTFAGGSATFEHIPADDRQGTITVSGGGGGAELTGDGNYSIADNGDGTLTMNMNVSSCIDVSGMCRDASHAVILTPG